MVKIPINSSIVPATAIDEFSNPKHVEMDGVDDSFLRGTFAFAVFMVPQTILLVFILKRVFHCVSAYGFSAYLRRFYFMGACVLQILLESNLSFFTYLFFRQMMVSFSFKAVDKAFLALSTVLFFCIMVSVCCFYFMANCAYKKGFGYFLYCFYRCFPSFVFLTCRYFVSGFAKGVIHSVLHQEYEKQMVLLCCVEAFVISVLIVAQQKCHICLTKSMYCLFLLYHFLFILLNVCLCFEEGQKKIEESEESRQILVQF